MKDMITVSEHNNIDTMDSVVLDEENEMQDVVNIF